MLNVTRLLAITALSTSLAASAAELMPDFSTLPTGWVTDRYEPASFSNVGTFQGRNDVLGIGISSAQDFNARPAGYQSTFYNTQGRQHAVSGGAGSTLSADLWVDASWSDSANGSIRTDMWGVMSNGASVTEYPIIGFTNYGGAARFRYWDNAGVWVDLGAAINYGGWNSFSIAFDGSSLAYSVNGSVVGTDATLPTTTGFSAVIMQAYNFGDDSSIVGAVPVDYTAHWSNAQTASVPDNGSTMILIAAALMSFGLIRRQVRR